MAARREALTHWPHCANAVQTCIHAARHKKAVVAPRHIRVRNSCEECEVTGRASGSAAGTRRVPCVRRLARSLPLAPGRYSLCRCVVADRMIDGPAA